MSGCCHNDCSLDKLREKQKSTLIIVFVINAVMFFVVSIAAFYGNSTSLLVDSVDNFGDALTYALSIYAVAGTVTTKAKIALFKGWLILLASFIIIAQIIYKLFVPSVPIFEIMGIFSFLGIIANSICFALLWRHRNEDINMSSVWECSRNDIASNISVFIGAGIVWATGSGWADIIIAMALVWLLTRSAMRIISSAKIELKAQASQKTSGHQ